MNTVSAVMAERSAELFQKYSELSTNLYLSITTFDDKYIDRINNEAIANRFTLISICGKVYLGISNLDKTKLIDSCILNINKVEGLLVFTNIVKEYNIHGFIGGLNIHMLYDTFTDYTDEQFKKFSTTQIVLPKVFICKHSNVIYGISNYAKYMSTDIIGPELLIYGESKTEEDKLKQDKSSDRKNSFATGDWSDLNTSDMLTTCKITVNDSQNPAVCKFLPKHIIVNDNNTIITMDIILRSLQVADSALANIPSVITYDDLTPDQLTNLVPSPAELDKDIYNNYKGEYNYIDSIYSQVIKFFNNDVSDRVFLSLSMYYCNNIVATNNISKNTFNTLTIFTCSNIRSISNLELQSFNDNKPASISINNCAKLKHMCVIPDDISISNLHLFGFNAMSLSDQQIINLYINTMSSGDRDYYDKTDPVGVLNDANFKSWVYNKRLEYI